MCVIICVIYRTCCMPRYMHVHYIERSGFSICFYVSQSIKSYISLSLIDIASAWWGHSSSQQSSPNQQAISFQILSFNDVSQTCKEMTQLKYPEMTDDPCRIISDGKPLGSGTCWGCKSYEYGWSTSDCSLDASPVDSLHTTLL